MEKYKSYYETLVTVIKYEQSFTFTLHIGVA